MQLANRHTSDIADRGRLNRAGKQIDKGRQRRRGPCPKETFSLISWRPFDGPPRSGKRIGSVKQYWHARVHHDPASQWLRGVCADLFQQHEVRGLLPSRAGPAQS
jgi:hypothetical protein